MGRQAASTLAQPIGMDQDKVLTWVHNLSFLVPPSLSFSLFLPLFLSFFLTGPYGVLLRNGDVV